MTTHYVYVDSRDATFSKNNTEFTIQLNENLTLGPDTTYRIDDFRMVNSMPNSTLENQYLWVRVGGNTKWVPLPTGYITAQSLAGIISSQLSAYAGGGWSVSYDQTQNALRITNSNSFYMVTDAELADGTYVPERGVWPSGASKDKPLSFNALIGNYSGNPARNVTHNEYRIEFLDLQIYDYVFLRSKHLASHKVTSVRSEHDICLKAHVNVAFGEIITASTPGFDSIHLGRTPHRALDFQITDRFGKPIPYLYDPRISFTLVFYG